MCYPARSLIRSVRHGDRSDRIVTWAWAGAGSWEPLSSSSTDRARPRREAEGRHCLGPHTGRRAVKSESDVTTRLVDWLSEPHVGPLPVGPFSVCPFTAWG